MKVNLNTSRRVIVGLSGGVDSSVTAALLKERGFDVRSVFMKNWHSDDPKFKGVCPWEEDLRDARAVAARLDIPFEVWNFEKQYHARVVRYFFDEYRRGRTPNPDVMCNKEIKFQVFLERALKVGADFVATGHYARLVRNYQLPTINYQLLTGKDTNKDQSYFLWAIDREVLPKIIMPIGEFTKPQVRELAKKFNLPTAEKKDSQGICFIGPINVREYLKTALPIKYGSIINTKNELVGEHEGVWFYTEGQRAGIGTTGGGVPYYVVGKDNINNILEVAPRRHKKLFARGLEADNLNWLTDDVPKSFRAAARIRYRHPAVPSSINIVRGRAKVIFDKPQRAVTPGQSVVFYQKDTVLGGGVILGAVL